MADCDIEPKGEGMPMNAEQRRKGKTIVLGINILVLEMGGGV